MTYIYIYRPNFSFYMRKTITRKRQEKHRKTLSRSARLTVSQLFDFLIPVYFIHDVVYLYILLKCCFVQYIIKTKNKFVDHETFHIEPYQ